MENLEIEKLDKELIEIIKDFFPKVKNYIPQYEEYTKNKDEKEICRSFYRSLSLTDCDEDVLSHEINLFNKTYNITDNSVFRKLYIIVFFFRYSSYFERFKSSLVIKNGKPTLSSLFKKTSEDNISKDLVEYLSLRYVLLNDFLASHKSYEDEDEYKNCDIEVQLWIDETSIKLKEYDEEKGMLKNILESDEFGIDTEKLKFDKFSRLKLSLLNSKTDINFYIDRETIINLINDKIELFEFENPVNSRPIKSGDIGNYIPFKKTELEKIIEYFRKEKRKNNFLSRKKLESSISEIVTQILQYINIENKNLSELRYDLLSLMGWVPNDETTSQFYKKEKKSKEMYPHNKIRRGFINKIFY